MNPFARKVLRILAAVLGVYLLGIGYVAWKMHRHTDLDDYGAYLAKWSPALVKHFPKPTDPLPVDASVSYFAGFLQGGAHLHLRLDVSADEALVHEAQASTRAIEIATLADDGDGQRALQAGPEPAPEPPYYFGSAQGNLSFPKRFTLYYFVAQPGTTDGFPWNHGKTAGMGISRQPPEVVYWAERW